MPLQIVRNDITAMRVDAIVNAANESLLGGGGVDGCIHHAAGPKLLAECRKLGGCKTGSAKLTGAGNLPCRYVIHAVGPRWQGGGHGERALLASCYQTALALAKEKECQTLAFPLISSGIYGYPKAEALRVAVDTIAAFLAGNDMMVYLVIFDKASYQIGGALFADITACIDDQYVEERTDRAAEQRRLRFFGAQASDAMPLPCAPAAFSAPRPADAPPALQQRLEQMDESFSEMLLRKIDESGMTDVLCYRRANVDRKLFSKIRSNRLYKPSKPTAVAFALALRLPLDETKELLMKAGYALSRSSKFDIIVTYFIEQGCYDVFQINEALFAFDQNLLGSAG